MMAETMPGPHPRRRNNGEAREKEVGRQLRVPDKSGGSYGEPVRTSALSVHGTQGQRPDRAEAPRGSGALPSFFTRQVLGSAS